MIHSDRFEQTVHAYAAELYRYAYWLGRDRHLAEDLVQETFSRAWKARERLRDAGAVRAWLAAILRNEFFRAFAHERGFETESLDEDSVLPEMPSFEAGVELRDLLAKLPLVYREPLVLQSLGGFSCAEIAAIIGIREGAVMTRLTRARQALRSTVAGIEAAPGRRFSR